MPDSQDCGQRDFSKYDDMSTQELQQLLREDASKIEGEDSDTALILYVMEVLARRNREENPGKTPEEALKAFKEQYDTNHFFDSEEREDSREKHSKQLWKRGLVAAAAAVVLLVGSIVTTRVSGFDLWETIAKWTQETFHFGKAGQENAECIPDGEDVFAYAGLVDALNQSHLSPDPLPTWLPEGYVEVQIDITETPIQRKVIALYQKENHFIQIKVSNYLGNDPSWIEQSGDLVEIYSVDGVDYHIFDNLEQLKAAWTDGSYEYYISGNLSLSEFKYMIDSIKKG